MRRTKNTNYDAELKFTMTKGKLHSLKTSRPPSLYCHKGDSREVFLPLSPCMCSIVVTLMNPSDLNPALNFFNLWNFEGFLVHLPYAVVIAINLSFQSL